MAPPAASSPTAQPPASERRPYELIVPPGVADEQPLPVVLFLHGYGASSATFIGYLGIREMAARHRFVAVVPDGTPDSQGLRFWNASEGCCNFEHKPVDDVSYLRDVIDEVEGRRAVDAKRIFVVGFSNGGFMAHRLACELGDRLAGIVSIAGAGRRDATVCRPKGSVSVLQIHGDLDRAVPYEGGKTLGRGEAEPHPPVRETVAWWAAHDGCSREPKEGAPMDLHPKLPGAETEVLRYEGCRSAKVELWTVRGGDHFVAHSREAAERYWAFLNE